MTGTTRLLKALATRAAVDIVDIASAAVTISRIPYGRSSSASPEAVIAEWHGTCTTKHLLFACVVAEVDSTAAVRLVHRVYRLSHEDATARWGGDVASTVPNSGLIDVHTYARLLREDQVIPVDVTFPLEEWDGNAPTLLACMGGRDFDAGIDPLATKAELVRRWCDPARRERFIAALTHHSRSSA
jgi:hypothetical protein